MIGFFSFLLYSDISDFSYLNGTLEMYTEVCTYLGIVIIDTK